METINNLYPFGRGFDSYLEYQLSCHHCGKRISLFLPATLTHSGYGMGGKSCHEFSYSINRGTRTFFPDKVIKLRNEGFGNTCMLFDHYQLYPLLSGETAEERVKRLTAIKQAELENRMTEHPEKKQWLIETLVRANDTVLHALEEVMKVYERTEENDWDKLDQALLHTSPRDDAISLLQRFHVECQHTIQKHPEPVSPFMVQPFLFQPETPSGIEEKEVEQPKAAAKPAAEEWTCSCGTKTTKKFCPNCGSPSPGLF